MSYEGDNEPTIWHATKGNEEDFRNGERDKHEEEKERLAKAENWTETFERMEHYLKCDFNLLVHGVGSKLDVLKRFSA
jgi:hypothetical protein